MLADQAEVLGRIGGEKDIARVILHDASDVETVGVREGCLVYFAAADDENLVGVIFP